jgi:hypothetical protein
VVMNWVDEIGGKFWSLHGVNASSNRGKVEISPCEPP